MFDPIICGKDIFNYYDFDLDKLPKNWKYLCSIEYSKRPKIQSMVMDGIYTGNAKYRRQVLDDIYREWEEGHSILALFLQKEYINSYYDSLIKRIPAEEIIRYYGDSNESDEELLEKAKTGQAKITLATFAKATEGTNVEAWEVLFLVSDIASGKNVEQAVGRIRRKKKGKLDPVRVYDYQSYEYNLRRHAEARMGIYKKLKCKVVYCGGTIRRPRRQIDRILDK